MSQQLLQTALEQAERSEPPIRAAALMHIARVLARSDQTTAEQLLERGIALAKELDGEASSRILSNAICLAAAVSAKQALPLYADHRKVDPFGSAVVGLVNAMAEHGHAEDAIAYLKDPLPGDRFPLHFVNNLERQCGNDEARLELLELAIQEWRNSSPRARGAEERFAVTSFAGLFSRLWNLLPREVAAPIVRELADWALGMKSEPREYPLTENLEDPRLTSDQEFQLFRLIPALQDLEPDLARSVLEAYPRLAEAVRRFPLGMRSVWQVQRKYDPSRDDAMMIGHSQVVYMTEALANDFEAAFREAYDNLARDSDSEDPNKAPKECWPSAWEFRNILFKAGQHQGLAAERYLERIPDVDLRLFAQIELCAGIAGLPQIADTIVRRAPKRESPTPAELDQIFGPTMPGIRCPKCKWTPRTMCRWSCKCEHQWNTFDTHGLCPGCEHQWESAACLQCGAMSPHSEWYFGNS